MARFLMIKRVAIEQKLGNNKTQHACGTWCGGIYVEVEAGVSGIQCHSSLHGKVNQSYVRHHLQKHKQK